MSLPYTFRPRIRYRSRFFTQSRQNIYINRNKFRYRATPLLKQCTRNKSRLVCLNNNANKTVKGEHVTMAQAASISVDYNGPRAFDNMHAWTPLCNGSVHTRRLCTCAYERARGLSLGLPTTFVVPPSRRTITFLRLLFRPRFRPKSGLSKPVHFSVKF